MEYCSHSSLQDLLDAKEKLAEPDVRFIVLQIVEAVKYMHSKLVIHRDLKPANIFLQSGLVTKIGDFGTAVQLKYKEDRERYVFDLIGYEYNF
jgi:cell cycle serine/threonine-protein kinase CDC5/MSD2